MSIQLQTITAPKILELIEQFLSETEQQWLSRQLGHLVQRSPLSLVQKRVQIDELCGAWSNDETLLPIFAEVEVNRLSNKPRDVSF
ncbi:MAG: hypothetical protein AAF702_18690 [Chloroflexota bacterium]